METWLIDARTLAKRPTGIGMYAYRLIRKLMAGDADLGTSGRERFVLVCDVKGSDEIRTLEAGWCEVRTYGKRVFNSLGVVGYFRFVKRVIDEVRPDVFWQPNNLQPFRPKGVRRVIVTMHDVFGLREWSWRYALWHVYYWLTFGRTLRNADEIWYNSEQTKREVEEAVRKLNSIVRLHLFSSPAIARITHPIAEVPRREDVTPYAHTRPFFLYVGNIEERKGADVLIAAYARYRTKAQARGEKPHDLVFAGLEKNVRVPRTEGIRLLGYVDDETKFALMCACEALVVPSRAEGYGMQVAEAAALHIPCLVSDLPVFHEIPGKRTTFRVGDADDLAAAFETIRANWPLTHCDRK